MLYLILYIAIRQHLTIKENKKIKIKQQQQFKKKKKLNLTQNRVLKNIKNYQPKVEMQEK